MNDWAKGRGIEVMAETKDGYVMLRKTDVAHLACFIEETRREIVSAICASLREREMKRLVASGSSFDDRRKRS